MASGMKIFGWILIIIGLLGVFVPHIGFLANMIPTLDTISHATVEIISGVLILIGAILVAVMKKRK